MGDDCQILIMKCEIKITIVFSERKKLYEPLEIIKDNMYNKAMFLRRRRGLDE